MTERAFAFLVLIRGLIRRASVLAGLAFATTALQLAGCAVAPDPAVMSEEVERQEALAERVYGIRVEGLHLSGAGFMLDFRYRVLDPKKAAPLLDSKLQPYLVDVLRGEKLVVPDTPVLGRIRQTARNHKIYTDRTYFIMFRNPGKAVQSGDRVSLLLGDVKITDLIVR